MNEELKIIIRAVTTEAKKNLADVKKELANIEKESGEAKKSIAEAMATIAKGTAAAVGTVVALTAAMAKLGHSAQDVNKGFSRLKSSFENAGSDAKEATKYYKELFGVLGDHDRAVETGQSIARITTDPTALNDYKNIMAGAVSQYGDGYNSEALAENISETVASAQVVGDLERVLVEAGISVDGFNAALQQTTSTEQREIMVRNTLNGLLGAAGQAYINANQATIAYNQSQANLNVTLADAARYTTPLMTELNNLSATLLTFFGPALQTVATYLTAFIQLIIEAIQWVGGFFGLFSGSSSNAAADIKGYQAAMQDYLGALRNSFGGTNTELDKTNDKLKELKKQTMGFDELNIVSNPTTAGSSPVGGGGGGPGTIPVAPNPADYGIGNTDFGFEDMKKDIKEAKEKLKGLLTLVAIIGAAFLLWKTAGGISFAVQAMKTLMEDGDSFLKAIKELPKYAKGYYDAMKGDGAWDKLIGKIKTFAGLAMIVAGAILLIKGYTDAWVNGLNFDNMIEMFGGIALVVGGLALAFGPVAAAIGLVVGGIAALVIGIKDFIENGYSMEAIITIAVGAIAVLIGVVWALNAALLANPITWIVVAIMALVAAFVVLWNECDAFRNFFIKLWDGIVVAFNATVAWFKQAGKDIASFFTNAWNTISKTFSGIGTWFKEKFQAAVTAIKNVFSSIGSFFSGIWTNIKNIFSKVGSTIGNAITNTVKSAINGVLSTAVKIINGFISAINFAIDIINAIPGVEITKLSKLEVPKLATGGILTKESLFIGGEGGKKEAVLPLDQNTEWMDILADRIAGRTSSPSKLVLMVDGKELGWASIHGINGIIRQTGTLPLEVAY